MRIVNKLFFLFLSFCFFLGLFFLQLYFTSGFKTAKVMQRKLCLGCCDYSASTFSENIFDQPFFYLGKGRQAYVFASQDGKFVLKLLRDQKYRPSLWMRFFAFYHLLSQEQKKILEDQERRCTRALESYQLTAKKLAEETEVVRISIGNFGKKKKIFLINTPFQRKKIDLYKTSFLVQKRADPLTHLFLRYQKTNDLPAQKALLHHFFSTIFRRCQKKIVVRDAHCTLQNTGVVEGKVIEIDVGSFYYDPLAHETEEIQRSSEPLRLFLEQKIPEILPLFYEEWRSCQRES